MIEDIQHNIENKISDITVDPELIKVRVFFDLFFFYLQSEYQKKWLSDTEKCERNCDQNKDFRREFFVFL